MHIPELDSEAPESQGTNTNRTGVSSKENAKRPQKASASSEKTTNDVGSGVGTSGKHKGRAELEAYLKQLNIKYQVRDHEEVFTVEALMKNVTDVPGLHMKNLFLKDKKKNLYLLSARHDAEVWLNCYAY